MPGSRWCSRSCRSPASVASVTTTSRRSRPGSRASTSQSAGQRPSRSLDRSPTATTTWRHGRGAAACTRRARRTCSSAPAAACRDSSSRNAADRKRVCRTRRSAPRSSAAPGSSRPEGEPLERVHVFLIAAERVVEPQHFGHEPGPEAEGRRVAGVARGAARHHGQRLAFGIVQGRGPGVEPFRKTEHELVRRDEIGQDDGPARGRRAWLRSMRTSCAAAARVGTTTMRSRASSGAPSIARPTIARRNAWRSGTRTRRVERGVITSDGVTPAAPGCCLGPATRA